MELFFDTETSDMYKWKLPPKDKSQPWIVQAGMILSTKDVIYAEANFVIQPVNREISIDAERVHNISIETAKQVGVPEEIMMRVFLAFAMSCDRIVCHNIDFDISMLRSVWLRNEKVKWGSFKSHIKPKEMFCTMKETTDLCKLPGWRGEFKWPKLQELHEHLFNEPFIGAHDAMYDVRATRKCYYKLMELEDKDEDKNSD